MKQKLLALNIGLGLIVVFAALELVSRIREADDRRNTLLGAADTKESPDFPAPGEMARLRPADYRPIVDRLLFSPDRNPVIEVAEPVEEKSERPAFPLLVGVMDFGDGPIAMMSETARGTPRPVALGEKVGDFKFLAVSRDHITLEWSGRKFEVGEDELTGAKASSAPPKAKRARTQRTAARRPSKAASSANLSGEKPKSVSSKHYIGPPLTGQSGRRAADPNDGVTDGTESDGWLRRVRKTPFGSQHWWEAQPK